MPRAHVGVSILYYRSSTDKDTRNSVREAIEQATTPISSVEPEDCEHHVAETANTRNESRPSRSAGPGPSNSRVETNPARREITDPTTGPETVVDTPKATTAQQAPAVQGSDSPNLLLRPLKRKLKDLEAGWEEKEYVSKLKHRLSDVKERNAELVEYVVELEGMVEALQAELAGK